MPERAVIIDNAVMEPGKEGLALFSGLHEAGHIMMHWDVFRDMIQNEAYTDHDSMIEGIVR